MKVITATLATILLATIATEALPEIELQCVDQEVGIRWPSYYNNADYYVCQGVGGKLMKMSCPDSEVFSFVLQVCSSPSKYIPPPPRDELPTASPIKSRPEESWNSVEVEEPFRPPAELPKPLMPKPDSTHLPAMPHLPHLPNGPKPPTVDLPGNNNPTELHSPPYVTDGQMSYLPNTPILPYPPTLENSGIPQPPMPQPPSIVQPPKPIVSNKPPLPPSSSFGSQKPTGKPIVPLPPTPAPTPPLVKMTTTKPAGVKPVKPVKPMPPSPPKKGVMPKVPVKAKKN